MDCPQEAQRCAKCGGPYYGHVATVGNSREPRCFPHYTVRQQKDRLRQAARQEERYRLERIDVGFPHIQGGVWQERLNAMREDAWGHAQLAHTGARRAGLDR